MVGFQVDKLIDAIQGEARIKITVYEHDQGQVKAIVCLSVRLSVCLSVGQSVS